MNPLYSSTTKNEALLSLSIKILSYGLSLWFFMIIIRAQILGNEILGFFTSPTVIARSILTSQTDFFLVFGVVLGFIGVGWVGRNHPRFLQFITVAFLIVAAVILLSQIVYSKFIYITGSAITYQWLFYSDFLNSPDAKNAVFANLSLSVVAMLTGLLVLMFGLGWMIYRILKRFTFRANVVYGSAVLVVLFVLTNSWYLNRKDWPPPYRANAIVTFLGTSPMFQSAPNLFEFELEEEELEIVSRQHQTEKTLPPIASDIRNVVLLVLESVPAEYIQNYNSQYSCTPNLAKFSDISLQVNNAYAHTPSTNKSMFSLVTSLYPWVSYSSITSEHPDLPVPSISSVLAAHNYQTAFITSADNRFQNIGGFLAHQSFGFIKDQQNIECDIKSFPSNNKDWLYLDAIADACIGNEFENWLDSISHDKNPFFAMLWTVQTHYPYFNVNGGENEELTTESSEFNRYLNALKESDRLFGDIMAKLKSLRLDSTTLVIVTGDHGESFGRHQQRGHATKIYEENVHVPLILFNPVLFSGAKSDRITGLIDVAPTILHTLGIQAPKIWQGKSILSDSDSEATYFFAPYSTFIFGYRENNFKYIYDAGYNITEVYDLRNDPLETINLIKEDHDLKERTQRRLAAFVQYHDKYMKPHIFR